MKKRSFKAIVMVCLMVLAMGLTACGDKSDDEYDKEYDEEVDDKDDEKDDDKDDDKDDEKDDDKDDDKDDEKGNGKYATMKDYVESEEAQAELKAVPKDDTMEISLTADGDKLVYTYKFTQIEKSDAVAEALEKGIEGQEQVFYSTANALKSVVNIDKPIVTVKYIDKNDNVIFSRDFEAK